MDLVGVDAHPQDRLLAAHPVARLKADRKQDQGHVRACVARVNERDDVVQYAADPVVDLAQSGFVEHPRPRSVAQQPVTFRGQARDLRSGGSDLGRDGLRHDAPPYPADGRKSPASKAIRVG